MNKYISFMIDLFTLGLCSVKSVPYAHHVVNYENNSSTYQLQLRAEEIKSRGVDPSSPFGRHLMKKLRDPYLPSPLLVNSYGDPVDGTGWTSLRRNSNGGGDCNLGGTVEGGLYTLKISVDEKKLDKAQKKVDRLFGKRPPYGGDTGER